MPKIDQPRCGRCEAGDWPYAANGGVERCDCLRGRALADADASRGRRRTDAPGITAEQAMIAIERLAVRMLMVPAGEFAHVELAGDLIELVCDTEELDWLVREATRRYPNWPGMRELRALYCAMFSPRDGVLVESAVYEGGFPQIAEPSPVRQLKQAKYGGQIGAEASVSLLARVVADISQPAAPPGRAGSDPHAAMAPPKTPPKVKPSLPTQEEIDAIKEQQRQNQERRKAIEAKNAIDSSSCKVIADTARHGRDVTTQPGNGLERATRAFLRLMRRWAGLGRLSYPSS